MLTIKEQNIMKTYFYFDLLPRISVGKTPFLFLAHGVYVDWQSPPLLQFEAGVKDLGSSREECIPSNSKWFRNGYKYSNKVIPVISGKSEGTLGKIHSFLENC